MEELLKSLSIVQKELKAPKNQRNSFGNYNYRSAEDILEAVKPLLFENNLTMVISDNIINIGDRYYTEATVTVYSSNGSSLATTASARESLDKKGMDSAQITGAASSYARKYALNGMFAIDDTKDADTMDNTKSFKKPVKEVFVPLIDDVNTIKRLGKDLGYDDKIVNAKIKTLASDQQAIDMIAKLTALSLKGDK